MSAADSSFVRTADVVVISNGNSIKGKTFFTTATTQPRHTGKEFDSGTILLSHWPSEIPWNYVVGPVKTFIGIFPRNKSKLVWTADLRKGRRTGGPRKMFGAVFGGHNEIVFDNALCDEVSVSIDNEGIPKLSPGTHARVVVAAGTHDLLIRRERAGSAPGENCEENDEDTITHEKIRIEDIREANRYIYNVGGANSYDIEEVDYGNDGKLKR